uniref:HSF-type DNA-binding domain-containing protein n=1 Tax=Trieres chinensis TaxID=1514140 RepID=A0A7S1ZB11_TRICV|mmetsp:Transcript_21689/g.43855  ORF Transcript_21689/g.43855 Transcript_21689/m.43855 type:complete len:360 (+) Transcript_21689:128-1207(+)|eukprot:CAMPEP_0183320662 /NCGR_PEP_ID=MMETSP0160_2-20130417/66845_1 /TAXON_ID=2839 ORGANISM="Odontella Sinensis, Strain Grunow 1884" /NCGR_SAMPLE_ID=MMETSP0160_2 /ASSEMBLY_ACC=CAM_ASM_000250 /LENGTH=359 /DNA_ID=CAMNT_0025487393 /DNA_START=79 /DNA_END=1158 /DNA_ORIENTATION=+
MSNHLCESQRKIPSNSEHPHSPQSQTRKRSPDSPYQLGHDGKIKHGKRGPSEDVIFPSKLYEVLSREDFSHIITWMPHGRSWIVVDKVALVEQVMTEYFSRCHSYASFMRQVNGWGFQRIKKGHEKGSYHHKLFLRGERALARTMRREAASKRSNAESDPDFSRFPPLPSTEEPKEARSNGIEKGISKPTPTGPKKQDVATAESFDPSPVESNQERAYPTQSIFRHEYALDNSQSYPIEGMHPIPSYPQNPIYTHHHAVLTCPDSFPGRYPLNGLRAALVDCVPRSDFLTNHLLDKRLIPHPTDIQGMFPSMSANQAPDHMMAKEALMTLADDHIAKQQQNLLSEYILLKSLRQARHPI